MPSRRHPKPPRPDRPLSRLELESIISLKEAEEISSLSAEVWRRHHADKIIPLSPERFGVRLKHALFIRDEV
jgi:hypothetical protein